MIRAMAVARQRLRSFLRNYRDSSFGRGEVTPDADRPFLRDNFIEKHAGVAAKAFLLKQMLSNRAGARLRKQFAETWNTQRKGIMKIESLEKLYVEELRDIYNAENQLLKALPKMAKHASSPALRDAFEEHLGQTEKHVERLERIFKNLDMSPKGKTCKGMKGLIEEGSEMLQAKGDKSALDAGLIGAAQRVEHYEIAAYGTVRAFAEALGKDDDAELLQQTLDEEGETNKRLTALAEECVNAEAIAA
jgi:ferritin-like metal-binding protein YciE